ncbi:STAS/SEC14 domain-containing protein [Sphingomonas sp. A2-49]|uniref:STAS/SEC14 domain-containing protein n=1 Tax=Sphingomonas sp. A2-49 TaxID=1391375 RepID=UPI0021D142A3|nr:STAS/SEC14 domain-containing protein [Sphingomonas sp. A2-49]MCU6452966.1 STAS/SEC14 domain-containing protein [Sphingomonas sp. A2-49]
MSAYYDVRADPDRDLIRITASGFFTASDVVALERAVRQAQSQLRCGRNRHVTLCDASGMRIQSQQVVADFARIARDRSLRSRSIAFVLGSSLARTQTRRISDPERVSVGYFEEVEAAEAWLCGGAVSAGRTVSLYPHAPASPTSGDHDCIGRSAA